MEDHRFDDLTRKFATPITRRQAFKALVATALGGFLIRSSSGKAFAGTSGTCTPNKNCAHFCERLFGSNTPAEEQCASDATKCRGLCYTCGPGSPSGTQPICCPKNSHGFCSSYSTATCCTLPNTCGGGGTLGVCGCTPNCSGKTCGDNGCGGSCGSCDASQCQTCSSRTCVVSCTTAQTCVDGTCAAGVCTAPATCSFTGVLCVGVLGCGCLQHLGGGPFCARSIGCYPACTLGSQCPSGTCINGQCTCTTSADCPVVGLACNNGLCTNCSTDADCPTNEGFVCIGGCTTAAGGFVDCMGATACAELCPGPASATATSLAPRYSGPGFRLITPHH